MPGVGLITLNGSVLPHQGGEGEPIEIPLPELGERNELIVEVILPEAGLIEGEQRTDWGEIALAVRQSRV